MERGEAGGLRVEIDPAEHDGARDVDARVGAHDLANGVCGGAISACVEAYDDEVEILDVVVLRGIDALGCREGSVFLSVECREVRL